MEYPPSGSIVWLMVTSSNRTCATSCAPQNCCCKSPCPHALQETFKHLQVGLTWSLVCGGVTVLFLGSWCTQGFFLCPPSISGRYEDWFSMGLHPSCCLTAVSPLPLDMGCCVFLWWVPTSFGWLFSTSYDFGVITGEDKCMSFYSSILLLKDTLKYSCMLTRWTNMQLALKLGWEGRRLECGLWKRGHSSDPNIDLVSRFPLVQQQFPGMQLWRNCSWCCRNQKEK